MLQLPSGSKDVKVGKLIALLVAEGENWKDVGVPGGAGGAPSSAAPAPQATPTFTGGNGEETLVHIFIL